jgi:hypothetical protein
LLNWLNGARFGAPLSLTVETQAIGPGTAIDLYGLNFRPWLFFSGS